MAWQKNTLVTSESQEAHMGVEESRRLRSHAHSMQLNDQIKNVIKGLILKWDVISPAVRGNHLIIRVLHLDQCPLIVSKHDILWKRERNRAEIWHLIRLGLNWLVKREQKIWLIWKENRFIVSMHTCNREQHIISKHPPEPLHNQTPSPRITQWTNKQRKWMRVKAFVVCFTEKCC